MGHGCHISHIGQFCVFVDKVILKIKVVMDKLVAAAIMAKFDIFTIITILPTFTLFVIFDLMTIMAILTVILTLVSLTKLSTLVIVAI